MLLLRYGLWIAALYLMYGQYSFWARMVSEDGLRIVTDGSGIGFYLFPFIAVDRLAAPDIPPFMLHLARYGLGALLLLGLVMIATDIRRRRA